MHVREQGLEWCGELPEFDPDGGAWTRIQGRRKRVVWVRRGRALAVVLMLAAVPVAYWAGRAEAPVVVVAQKAADTELVEARTPELAGNEKVRLLEAQLERVDRELQTRYDAHASAAELETLWRSRHELENALLVAYRRPAELVAL